MRACVRSDDSVCSDKCGGARATARICAIPAVVQCSLGSRADRCPPSIQREYSHPRRAGANEGTDDVDGAGAGYALRRGVWDKLHADDACIVSQSPQGLAKMMEDIVIVWRAFALTVSAKKTETMCMPSPRTPRKILRVEVARLIYKPAQSLIYLGGTVTKTLDMSVEIARRTRVCWMCIRRYLHEIYDQPNVAISLKPRMVKAEAIEALLHGFNTRTVCDEHNCKARTVHHWVLLRIIGTQRKRPDPRMTSENRALEITRSRSIKTTLFTRRLLWAGALIRLCGGGCQSELCLETSRVQCGEDGVGSKECGPIAYIATSGRLALREIGRRRHWRLRCGLRRLRRVG